MFKVKYYLDKSNLSGIGLFSGENIKKGQLIYVPNENLSCILSQQEFDKIGDEDKRIFKHYGYFNKNKGIWRLDYDDIRFCNHSENSNIILVEGGIIAKKDISEGEELTQNYKELED